MSDATPDRPSPPKPDPPPTSPRRAEAAATCSSCDERILDPAHARVQGRVRQLPEAGPGPGRHRPRPTPSAAWPADLLPVLDNFERATWSAAAAVEAASADRRGPGAWSTSSCITVLGQARRRADQLALGEPFDPNLPRGFGPAAPAPSKPGGDRRRSSWAAAIGSATEFCGRPRWLSPSRARDDVASEINPDRR